MNPDLLIVSATRFEISHFLTLHPGDSSRVAPTGATVITGRVGRKTYDLVITGPGVFNAAHAVTAYLEKNAPALMLMTGFAGIFRQTQGHIGDIAIATQERYIHTGVQADGLVNDPLPFDLIDAHPLTRKGIYPFEQDRVDQISRNLSGSALSNTAHIFKGPFITVSTITAPVETADRIYSAFSPVMEAMEGAACAHIAALYEVPMIEVRAASNYVGERDKTKWDMKLAAKQLGWVCALI